MEETLSHALSEGENNQLTAAAVHEYHEATMNLLTTHGTSVASKIPFPNFTTPIFEGPLDLLLHLIRANEVDIYDIPIAEMTRQYLSYMALLEALDLEVAGEYLVIAATLIEIKSRMLLPQAPPQGDDEAEDPRAELVARLVEYQQFQGIGRYYARMGSSFGGKSSSGALSAAQTITSCRFLMERRMYPNF